MAPLVCPTRASILRCRCSSILLTRLPQRIYQSTQTPQHGFPRAPRNERVDGVNNTSSIFSSTRNISKKEANSISHKGKIALFLKALGPLSLTDLEIQKRLQNPGCDPTQVLRQSIAAGTASTHVVVLCLDAQYQEVKQWPRKERQDIAKSQSDIAAVVLGYILPDERLWGPFMMHCPGGQRDLAYYAIQRGHGDRLLGLLHAETRGEKVVGVWRGSLLRNVVMGHVLHDFTNNQTPAIRCFLDVLAQRNDGNARYMERLALDPNVQKPRFLNITLLPTCVLLSDTLTSNHVHNTDPKVFDQLIQAFQSPETYSAQRSQAEIDFDVASLKLFHPTHPQHTDAMTLLQNFAAGKLNALPERVAIAKGQQYFKRFLQRTIDLLLELDNTAERDWVKHKFNVLIDPATGNFDEPTRIRRPGSVAGRLGRDGRAKKESVEPVPFPTFM